MVNHPGPSLTTSISLAKKFSWQSRTLNHSWATTQSPRSLSSARFHQKANILSPLFSEMLLGAQLKISSCLLFQNRFSNSKRQSRLALLLSKKILHYLRLSLSERRSKSLLKNSHQTVSYFSDSQSPSKTSNTSEIIIYLFRRWTWLLRIWYLFPLRADLKMIWLPFQRFQATASKVLQMRIWFSM